MPVPSHPLAAALDGSLQDYRLPRGPDLLKRCEDFFEWQDTRRRAGLWPYARSTNAGPSTNCAIRDDSGNSISGVNFASQDYLGLSSHPAIVESAKSAADQMGVHSAGSSALLGNTSISVSLERELADFASMSHSVLFPTGWAAGFGALRGLVRPHDYILVDRLAHACLMVGAHSATRNVQLFRHLDVDHCRKKLAAIRAKDPQAGILVVTESLFSMDSDTPDIGAFQTLAREYGATLMVDMAHDLGNLGPNGTGHVGAQGLLGQVDVVMGSFSKTFASNGGFVATNSRAVAEYLRYYSPSTTFSNALSPIQAAVISKALEIVRSEEGDQLRGKLMDNVLSLREQIRSRGLEVYGDPSAIVCVRAGDEALARLASRELPSLGLLANMVEFPAVAKGEARFRLQVMAGHDASDIQAAAACMEAATKFARLTLDALNEADRSKLARAS